MSEVIVDRPFISEWTSTLERRAESAAGDFDVLHQLYIETLFRKRTQAGRLRLSLGKQLESLQAHFAWPSTDVLATSADPDGITFQHRQGLLGFLGYRVGLNGATSSNRHDLLDLVMTSRLPKINSADYMAEWSTPNSMRRLKKLTESIACFVRTAKRNSPERYTIAIKHWESDLQFLKRKYYRPASFAWPKVDVG